MKRFSAILLVGAALMGASTIGSTVAAAQTAPAAKPYDGPVVVIVSFPMKPGMTRADVEGLFAKYTPYYQSVDGLKQKYFTVNETTRRMGGVYLWVNRATAERFYNAAWRAQVVAAFGAEPDLVWYDTPSVILGKAGMP